MTDAQSLRTQMDRIYNDRLYRHFWRRSFWPLHITISIKVWRN